MTSRMIHADGKVVTPLFKAHPGDTKVDKETGELRPVRAEHDAALHFEGTGETAWGTKWVLVASRSEDVHGQIIGEIHVHLGHATTIPPFIPPYRLGFGHER